MSSHKRSKPMFQEKDFVFADYCGKIVECQIEECQIERSVGEYALKLKTTEKYGADFVSMSRMNEEVFCDMSEAVDYCQEQESNYCYEVQRLKRLICEAERDAEEAYFDDKMNERRDRLGEERRASR